MKRAAALLAATASLAVHAGRPLSTEDASALPDHACQVEAWIDRSREATTSWMVPACNFGGGIEWQAGFARTHQSARSFFSESYVQAKTVLRKPSESDVGYGLVAGLARLPRRETHRGWEDPYVTVPLTFELTTKSTVHANLGWIRDREVRRDAATWGAGAEHELNDRATILGEVFGIEREKPFVRLGARFVAIPKRLDLDLTVVARSGGPSRDRYVSLGLTWQALP